MAGLLRLKTLDPSRVLYRTLFGKVSCLQASFICHLAEWKRLRIVVIPRGRRARAALARHVWLILELEYKFYIPPPCSYSVYSYLCSPFGHPVANAMCIPAAMPRDRSSPALIEWAPSGLCSGSRFDIESEQTPTHQLPTKQSARSLHGDLDGVSPPKYLYAQALYVGLRAPARSQPHPHLVDDLSCFLHSTH